MEEFAVALIVPALVYVGVTLLKAVRAKNWDTVTWVVGGWVIGFLALMLARSTGWADQITLGDTALEGLSIADLVVGGLFAGALASVGFDVLGAVRNLGQNQLTTEERDLQLKAMERAVNAPDAHPLTPFASAVVTEAPEGFVPPDQR